MYTELGRQELEGLQALLKAEYEKKLEQGLKLDMSRGKPGPDQLDFSNEMNELTWNESDYYTENGTDVRNYGVLEGIPEARQLFADLAGVKPSQVLAGGNSSLQMMFDAISRAMTHGIMGETPWGKLEKVKFLCPVPGYDRHFGVTEFFGVEMINIPMGSEGPDMDLVAEHVEKDPLVKGIWSVPKYSNPTGITYSPETVRRFAGLKPAAKDFRIFWDNAYFVHHLFGEDNLLNILEECEKAGNPDMVYQFASTSKVTYPGAGISAMMASETNIKDFQSRLFFQTIGPDKMNQLRHIRFLKDSKGVAAHMGRHAEVLRPKFRLVREKLEEQLDGTGVAQWTNPNGGYFVSVDVYKGTAKRTVSLCKEAGLVLTGAGATYPYGRDPEDKNIRIAPTYPSLEELGHAMDLFCLCAKLAAAEKLLESNAG